MTASSLSFAARERAALADLLAELGPDAPTCCASWSTGHLAAHLVVRDRRPDAMPGFALEVLPAARVLTAHSHRLEERLLGSTPYGELVDRVRQGPPPWLPGGWPGMSAIDIHEFAIHHEDVRRAQPDWSPRPLDRADQDTLWPVARFYGRRAAGRRGLVLRRSDVEGAEKRIGAGGRTVAGDPMELLLWTAGRRDVARVTMS